MIAADTSSLVALLRGDPGQDVDKLAAAIAAGELVLPPVVVTEILSDPSAAPNISVHVADIATLDIRDGYWIRAAETRRTLIKAGLKARVADALIAQACIDHDVALITRDRDFRHFARHCSLKLA